MLRLIRWGGLVGLLLLPQFAHAAVLSLIPERTQVGTGETVRVEVALDTEGEEVNALEIVIPIPDNTEVKSVEYGNSVISLWVTEPIFDKKERVVRLVGGMPGGFNGIGPLATIILSFSPSKEGEQEGADIPLNVRGKEGVILAIGDAQILLNDGEGRPVKTLVREGTTLEIATGATTLEIRSETHPDSSGWYSGRTLKATWNQKEGAAYSILIDDGPLTTSDDIPEELTFPIEIKNVPDGIHYVHVRERNAEGIWSYPEHFRVQVDGTLPEPFSLERDGELLSWSTTDKLSGIANYRVSFAPRPFSRWPSMRRESPQKISGLASFLGGSYQVTAVDGAGNERTAVMEIPAGRLGPTVITVLLIIILFIIAITLWRLRQKKIT